MKKALPKILIGLTVTLAGLGIGFLFVSDTSSSKAPIFLIVSIILLAGGLFLLSRVGEAVYNLNTQSEDAAGVPTNNQGFQSVLDKNNEMVADYAKTAKTRDELKVLEIAGAAEEQAQK